MKQNLLEGFATDTNTVNPSVNTAEMPLMSRIISSGAQGVAKAKNAYNSFLDIVSPNEKMFRKIENDDFGGLGDDATQYISNNSQSHTALIIPDTDNYKYGNYSNLKNISSINGLKATLGIKNGFENIYEKSIDGKTIPDLQVIKEESNADKPMFQGLVMAISNALAEKGQLKHSFVYAKQPIPSGETPSSFMYKNNRVFRLEGQVSNIGDATVHLLQTNIYKSSPLSQLTSDLTQSLTNTYGIKLKTKLLNKFNNDIVTPKIGEKISTGIAMAKRYKLDKIGVNAVKSAIGAKGANPIWNGKELNLKGSKQDNDNFSICQYFIAMLDILASAGYLFNIYFCGIKYTNIAIIDIDIINYPKGKTSNTSAIGVSLLCEQIPITRATQKPQNSTVKATNKKFSNNGKTRPQRVYWGGGVTDGVVIN